MHDPQGMITILFVRILKLKKGRPKSVPKPPLQMVL